MTVLLAGEAWSAGSTTAKKFFVSSTGRGISTSLDTSRRLRRVMGDEWGTKKLKTINHAIFNIVDFID